MAIYRDQRQLRHESGNDAPANWRRAAAVVQDVPSPPPLGRLSVASRNASPEATVGQSAVLVGRNRQTDRRSYLRSPALALPPHVRRMRTMRFVHLLLLGANPPLG